MSWVVLFALVAMVWIIVIGPGGAETPIKWNEFVGLAKDHSLVTNSVYIDDSQIKAEVKPGTAGFGGRCLLASYPLQNRGN